MSAIKPELLYRISKHCGIYRNKTEMQTIEVEFYEDAFKGGYCLHIDVFGSDGNHAVRKSTSNLEGEMILKCVYLEALKTDSEWVFYKRRDMFRPASSRIILEQFEEQLELNKGLSDWLTV